jgi:colanic acid biosynthesis protein WcaH
MFLDDTTFKAVIASTPLISIDLVVKNTKGEYLLGFRNNRPAQGFWFVPNEIVASNDVHKYSKWYFEFSN